MEIYKDEKRKVKSCMFHSKNEENQQYSRKINQGVKGNRKLFRKGLGEV